MEKAVRLLTIRFKNPIADFEIPLFRGAVIRLLEENADPLFHNHAEDGRLRYAYPLIQYKSIGGRAAIVCVEEGTEAIGRFFAGCKLDCRWGQRCVRLAIDTVDLQRFPVAVGAEMQTYAIRRWFPLNSSNYARFKQQEGPAGRIQMLEKILTGNLLSFLKGVGLHVEQRIACRIQQTDDPRRHSYKGVEFLHFDAVFRTNLHLPDFIGIGKKASLNSGIVSRLATASSVFPAPPLFPSEC